MSAATLSPASDPIRRGKKQPQEAAKDLRVIERPSIVQPAFPFPPDGNRYLRLKFFERLNFSHKHMTPRLLRHEQALFVLPTPENSRRILLTSGSF